MILPITTVGSWPRPRTLIQAQRACQSGFLPRDEFERQADDAVRRCVQLQIEAGVDFVTDGEQRRDNFYSFVTEKISGTKLMTLGEMMEHVEDRDSFEDLLQRLDVPASAIRNPTATDRIARRFPLAVDEYRYLKSITDKMVKLPLPGPYLLSRAMWVPEVTSQAYASKEELAEDVVALLQAEVQELAELGVEFIQFDEPVLTELAFSQGKTRTFMCAALAARNDPAEELAWAVSLINRVAEAAPTGVRVGVHVCRGNWSRREETLLQGSYGSLKPWLEQLKVDQLVLEYATPRAGELVPMPEFEIGLGVVNPRTELVESPEQIASQIQSAREIWRDDQIFLNPDCGFATFSERAMNSEEIAVAKIRAMVAARDRFGG